MEEIVAETTSRKKDKAIGVCVLTALAKKNGITLFTYDSSAT